jgi:hypothetical protein
MLAKIIKRMKRAILFLSAAAMLTSCGSSYIKATSSEGFTITAKLPEQGTSLYAIGDTVIIAYFDEGIQVINDGPVTNILEEKVVIKAIEY